jgi:hypothetical protein
MATDKGKLLSSPPSVCIATTGSPLSMCFTYYSSRYSTRLCGTMVTHMSGKPDNVLTT